MAAGKWIGGILGFMSGGALGALAGVALGALFDYGINAVNKDGEPKNGYGSTSFGRQGFGSATREQQYYEGQRNSFFVLSACSGVVYYQGRRQGDAQRDGVCAEVLACKLR